MRPFSRPGSPSQYARIIVPGYAPKIVPGLRPFLVLFLARFFHPGCTQELHRKLTRICAFPPCTGYARIDARIDARIPPRIPTEYCLQSIGPFDPSFDRMVYKVGMHHGPGNPGTHHISTHQSGLSTRTSHTNLQLQHTNFNFKYVITHESSTSTHELQLQHTSSHTNLQLQVRHTT
jgi:hypothetical protein